MSPGFQTIRISYNFISQNRFIIYSERPKTERLVWETERNLVQLSNVPISDVWDQTEQIGTKISSKPVWNWFVFDKPNDFVQISDVQLLYNQTKAKMAEIRTFGFWTFTVFSIKQSHLV